MTFLLQEKGTGVSINYPFGREAPGVKKLFFFFFLVMNLVTFLLVKNGEGLSTGSPSQPFSNRVLSLSSFGAVPGALIALNMDEHGTESTSATDLQRSLKLIFAQNILFYLMVFLRPRENRKKENRKVSYNNGRF